MLPLVNPHWSYDELFVVFHGSIVSAFTTRESAEQFACAKPGRTLYELHTVGVSDSISLPAPPTPVILVRR